MKFTQKTRIAACVAAAAMIAACGGGGGDSSTVASAGSAGTLAGATPVVPAGANTPAGTGTPTGNTTTPSGSTGTTPTTTPGATPPATTPAVSEQQLRGYLSIVGNQLPYLQTNRSIYNAVSLSQFETGIGMYDVASGSRGTDGAVAVPPSAVAPAAPLAAFGFRIDRFVQRTSETQAVGNQTVVGRVGMNLVEIANSPGIRAGEVAESMRFVIDRIEFASNANGELTTVRVLDGARMHVTGRNAAGVEVQETLPVPANAVRLMPVSQVLDHYGDTSSIVLLFDLEAAFSQAGQRLAALENITGRFGMQVTMTAAQLVRPAAPASSDGPALERRDLVGQPITVTGQPTVNGSGLTGSVWIRAYPPQ